MNHAFPRKAEDFICLIDNDIDGYSMSQDELQKLLDAYWALKDGVRVDVYQDEYGNCQICNKSFNIINATVVLDKGVTI